MTKDGILRAQYMITESTESTESVSPQIFSKPFNNKLWRKVTTQICNDIDFENLEAISPFGFELLNDKKFLQNNIRRLYCIEIFISKKMHIDGIMEIFNIDGYDISLQKETSPYTNKKFSYEDIKNL
jgi:hypothetical protein